MRSVKCFVRLPSPFYSLYSFFRIKSNPSFPFISLLFSNSQVPAAAVIPAPRAYTHVAAVKTLVVEFLAATAPPAALAREWGVGSAFLENPSCLPFTWLGRWSRLSL